ncbi:hypothetical protein MBLNU13_g10540t1 [Cladosporium sp. NU13]
MLLRLALAALGGARTVWAADDTDSTSTVTLQSFVTLTATTNALGDLIMQGLGGETTTISTAQALPPPATIAAPFRTNNATATIGWEACQTSQVSWSEAWTSAYQPEVITMTESNTLRQSTITFNVSFGIADVYTTIEGIPHAHGELKATSTSQFVDTYSEIVKRTITTTETLNATFLNSSPTCTIAPSKCTNLWESYLDEQGMPTTFENATEPAVTPMPTQRPRCSVGTVTQICETAPPASCIFSARKVDLYYWPETTAAPNASLSLPNPTEVATQVIRNVTMTSPSVYLIFDHLQALSQTILDISCSTSSPLGATATFDTPRGGAEFKLKGGPYVDAVVSLDPTSLSSLVRDLGPVNTASVVSEIAHGGPSYYYWINAVRGTEYNFDQQRGFSTSVLAKPVDFHNLAVPKAEAYYMNINGAPGCNRMGDHPQCSTIFDGDYRAQLLVPKQVRSLRPEWADCYDPLYGALDPPIALTPAAAIKAPDKPASPTPEPTTEMPAAPTPEDPTKEPEETPAAPGPTVPSKPSPTTPPSQGTPSAIPDTKPDEESDDKPSSDDKPGSDDEPASNDKPAPDDKPASEDKPTSNDKPAPSDEPASQEKPMDNDKPASDDTPASNDTPTANDNPASNDQPASDDNSASDPSKGDSSSNTDSSGQSSNNDSEPSQSEGDGKKPQNALDVLNAPPQNDAAKETGVSESGGSDESVAGQSQGKGNSDDQEDVDEAGSNGNDSSSTQVVQIDGTKHTVVAHDGAPVIDGTTLPADGSPKTIDGQVVSAVDEGVVIGTQTVRPTSDPTPSLEDIQKVTFTANGQTFTAAPGSKNGEIMIDGATISAGHAAVTLNGAVISAGSDGFDVDGSIVSYADITTLSRPAVVTLGSDVATASTISSGVFAIGSVTLTAGESGTTISGHTVSAGPSGIVVDGDSSSTSATGTQESQQPQGTGSTSPGPESDAPSAAASRAAKLEVFKWAILAVCSFALVF